MDGCQFSRKKFRYTRMAPFISSSSCPCSSAMMHVGGVASAWFRGSVSLVQVWDNVRDIASEIIPVYNANSGRVNVTSYTQGLVADWSWEGFQPGPGMTRVSPSVRGHMVCPYGQQPDTPDTKCIDKPTGKVGIIYL